MKDKILEILQSADRSNPVYSQSIADTLDIQEEHATCVKTRMLIKELIEDGYPIGATGNGYFWIHTLGELFEYTDSLKRRIAGIEKRIANVQLAFIRTITTRKGGVHGGSENARLRRFRNGGSVYER